MDNTGQKVLEKIKEDQIKPKPKWEFLLKDYMMWAIFGLGILVGSLATSVIIFMVSHTDWRYYSSFGGPLKQFLISLPYFWLVILALFIAVSFYNFKHTKKGYRHNALVIVLISVAFSLIIGSIVYAIGGGEKLEEIFYRRVPFYKIIIEQHGRMILNPEQGIIAGVVIEVNENSIKVRDFRGVIWSIATSTDQFIVGQRVHLIGQRISEREFRPNIMGPWFPEPKIPSPGFLKGNFR